MKTLASIITLGLAIAFTAPAFAAEKAPTTKAACERANLGHIGEEVQVGILFLQTEAAFDQPLLSGCSDF